MTTINQRITKIIAELYSGNKRAFSNKIGVSAAVIENIVGKRQSSPSFDITNKILLSLDNISADWLITGKGEMFKCSSEGGVTLHNIGNGNIASNGNINNIKYMQSNDSEKTKELELLLIEKEAEIKSLKNTIEMLIQSIKK